LAVPTSAPSVPSNEIISSMDFCDEKNILGDNLINILQALFLQKCFVAFMCLQVGFNFMAKGYQQKSCL